MNTISNTVFGIIEHRGRTITAQVPRELLILNTLSYARARAEQLRAEAMDSDYTVAERNQLSDRANFLKNWVDTGCTAAVPFDVDLNLFLRTNHIPTVVDFSNVDDYLDMVLSVSTIASLEEAIEPQFAILNTEASLELWVTNNPSLRNAKRFPSPCTTVIETTSDKVKATIAIQSVMNEADFMAEMAA